MQNYGKMKKIKENVTFNYIIDMCDFQFKRSRLQKIKKIN